MKPIRFQKWQGAGNDFILLDDRNGEFTDLSEDIIRRLCDRHFGIGADGLMRLSLEPGYDFRMDYFNSDGLPAEMCGNGGRCITAMAYELGLFRDTTRFLAPDGPHEAERLPGGEVRLRLREVEKVEGVEGVFLNTGVPHLVVFVPDVSLVDVFAEGRRLRHDVRFGPAGTNVNFVSVNGNHLMVRTYERGVENETLACGTGNVASAVAAEWLYGRGFSTYTCKALGGTLKVSFTRGITGSFQDVDLEGPAEKVFEGTARF